MAEDGVVEVPGAKLRYRVEGRGTPCLVIGSAVYTPRTFSATLREEARLVFADARYFALEADPDVSKLTLETHLDDIERVRRALDLGGVVVIGHSIAGPLALEYGRRHPESILGAVVIGGPAQLGSDAVARELMRYFEANASEERKTRLGENLARMQAEIAAATPGRAAALQALASGPLYWYDIGYDAAWLWEGVEPHTPILEHLYGELFRDWRASRGGPVAFPVFAAFGRHDYVAPLTLWEGETEAFADLTMRTFEKAGHTPQLEVPEEFDAALKPWLERQRPH